MTTVCTSSARACIAFPGCAPQLCAPPIASTGIASRRFLRSSFWARVASHARVEREAAAQRVGVAPKKPDVIADDLARQRRAALVGELVAEEEVLASPDQVLGHRVGTVERDVPELLVD